MAGGIDWDTESKSVNTTALRVIAEELARANRLKRLELEHDLAVPLRPEINKAWEG